MSALVEEALWLALAAFVSWVLGLTVAYGVIWLAGFLPRSGPPAEDLPYAASVPEREFKVTFDSEGKFEVEDA